LNIGGVERQLYYLVQGINKRKYDMSIVLCKKEGEFVKKIPKNIELLNLSVNYLTKRKLLISIKLFFLLKREKPDIFISFHDELNSISVFICRLLKIKVICCFPGYFNKGRLNFIRNIYLQWADRLVAVSSGVKSSLENALYGIESAKISVIPNAIDYHSIKSSSKENLENNLFANSYPIVASLGRIIRVKRFDILIKSTSYINTKCNILIIGDGPEKENLKKLCQSMELTDQVLFVGMQTNPYKYLANADLFVLPSEEEGLPTVILEAKALKIPCICADYLGGTKGVIDHKINGYVFKRNDEKELAYAIDLLLNDSNLKKKFIQNSFIQIKEEFDIETYIYRYQKLLDAI